MGTVFFRVQPSQELRGGPSAGRIRRYSPGARGRQGTRSVMRDPFYYSMPLGRMFGVTIRVHWLFPFVALALILRTAFDKDVVAESWIDQAMLVALLFVSVLLHELGHCFGARHVNGD